MTKKTKATKMLKTFGFEVLTFDWTENHEHNFNGITIAIHDEDGAVREIDIEDRRHDPDAGDWVVQPNWTYDHENGRPVRYPSSAITRKELTQIFEVIDYLEK